MILAIVGALVGLVVGIIYTIIMTYAAGLKWCATHFQPHYSQRASCRRTGRAPGWVP